MINQPDWEGQLQRAHPEHPAPARLQRVLLQGPREVRLRRLRERALFMVLLTWKNKYFATIVLSVKIYDVGYQLEYLGLIIHSSAVTVFLTYYAQHFTLNSLGETSVHQMVLCPRTCSPAPPRHRGSWEIFHSMIN